MSHLLRLQACNFKICTLDRKYDVCLSPKQLDEEVATYHLPVLGTELTVFTEEQTWSCGLAAFMDGFRWHPSHQAFIENVIAFSTFIHDITFLDHMKMNIVFVGYIGFFTT